MCDTHTCTFECRESKRNGRENWNQQVDARKKATAAATACQAIVAFSFLLLLLLLDESPEKDEVFEVKIGFLFQRGGG